MVVKAYQGNLLGKDVDLSELVQGLSDSCKRVNDGDLSTLEAMLTSQATALQTVFTSLVCRAQVRTQQRQLEAFMGLAFKAQAQSRAPYQRKRQSEAIRRWKLWQQSTGPKSFKGKTAVSGNAWAGGDWLKLRQAVKALNQAMRLQKDWLG